MSTKHILPLALLAGLLTGTNLHAQLYVSSYADQGLVGEYDVTTGASINANLISGQNIGGMALSGSTLYLSTFSANTVGEYNATTGAAINANFITGLSVGGLALSGNTLYTATGGSGGNNGSVGEYNATTGTVINANLITGLYEPACLMLSGTILYVAEPGNGEVGPYLVGEYNAATGAVINANLISGLTFPDALALSGNTLYVGGDGSSNYGGSVGEYNATTGAAINANFIATNLLSEEVQSIALSGTNLFVAYGNSGDNEVAEYNATTGAIENADFIYYPDDTPAILVVAVPEPSTCTMLAIGGAGLLFALRRRVKA